ncbi:hypothetical protein CHS0354_018943 [Potamilus streckersoni]|uniref:Uncharacterized protein n=1 Tax=Potamilus streckersoni TaxID=2493646 RepID=A0AAE0T6G9_9BIVA|nr:hypothetical protein CHS0354_018943 [Potamilus streckersoni]
MDIWTKYLDKMAKASQKFFEETIEIVRDMEKDIGELSVDRSENGVYWKTAIEFNVEAFRARAEAARIVAEIDREAVRNLNSFVEDKEVVKEIKETEKEFKEAKKSFSKIAEKLDVKHKKVTRTYRRLQQLRRTNVATDNELEKAQRKLIKARKDFNNTADKEERKRQKLIQISDRYETQAKQVTRDKVNCLVSTWKQLFENHTRLSFDERSLYYDGLLAINKINVDEFIEELSESRKLNVSSPAGAARILEHYSSQLENYIGASIGSYGTITMFSTTAPIWKMTMMFERIVASGTLFLSVIVSFE